MITILCIYLWMNSLILTYDRPRGVAKVIKLVHLISVVSHNQYSFQYSTYKIIMHRILYKSKVFVGNILVHY